MHAHTFELACCLLMQALVQSPPAAQGVCRGHIQPVVELQLKNMLRMLILVTAK